MSETKINKSIDASAETIRKLRLALFLSTVVIGLSATATAVLLLSRGISSDVAIASSAKGEEKREGDSIQEQLSFTLGAPTEIDFSTLSEINLTPRSDLSDFVFELGAPTLCFYDGLTKVAPGVSFGATRSFSFDEAGICRWVGNDIDEPYASADKIKGFATWVDYRQQTDGDYVYIVDPARTTFSTVDEMREQLGEEGISSVHVDLRKRKYYYPNLAAEYTFEGANNLTEILLGPIRWGTFDENTLEYMVEGRVICPGEECPWDEAGLKSDYENASYRDFLPD